MRASTLGPVAAAMLLAGVAGCSLPEVLPLAGGTTAGPSPYGPWYEQHWATNSVLLAAADQPEDDWSAIDEPLPPDDLGALPPEDDLGVDATPGAISEDMPVEASAAFGDEPVEFNNSTPYQFPASQFAPVEPVPAEPSPEAVGPAATEQNVVPQSGGPIRY